MNTSSGVEIDNDNRDRTELGARARAAYEMFPGYFAVGEIGGNLREYDSDENAGGFDRSSDGFYAHGGIGLDLSRLVRGDFLVGYFSQDYDDAALSDPSGVSVQSVFNWTPSKMTLVVASLRRDVSETTNTAASAIIRSSASLLVRHELRRNLVLSLSGQASYDEYDGVDGDSFTHVTRGSATYAFNERVYSSLEVIYSERSVDGTVTTPYDQLTASIRFGIRM